MQQLAGLGKVAGIGGIALGAAVLLLRPLIEQVLPGLEPAARAHAVQVIALGAFALGGLGILCWIIGSRGTGSSVETYGNRSPGYIAQRDISLGGDSVARSSATETEQKAVKEDRGPAVGRVVTRGDDSPGAVAGRDFTDTRRPDGGKSGA
jgi:hypothetical protein